MPHGLELIYVRRCCASKILREMPAMVYVADAAREQIEAS